MRFCRPLLWLALFALPSRVFAVDPFSTHNPAHFAGEQAAYLDASLFLGNDVLPIRTLLKDDPWTSGYSPKAGLNLAIATSRVESGVVRDGWRIGYVNRMEWVVGAQRDTLDFYRAIQSNAAFPAGNSAVRYNLEGWTAQGMQLGKAWRQDIDAGRGDWKLDFGLSVSLLKGQRMRSESWSGQISNLGNDTVLLDAEVNRAFNDMDKSLDRTPVIFPNSASGQGYALDLGVSLGRDDGLRLDWAIADALGALNWQDVPAESLQADQYVVCAQFDANCSLAKQTYRDRLGGVVPTMQDVHLKLKPKHLLTLSIPVNQAHVELGDSIRDGEHFPRIGVRQYLRDGWGTRVDYDFRMKSLGFALAHRWLYVNVQADDPRPAKAKVFGAGLGARIPF